MKCVSRCFSAALLAVLFTVLMLAQPVLAAGVPFDVEGRPCAEDVEKLQYIGVLGGYPDGTYLPDNPIRRSEMAKIIAMCKHLEQRSRQLMGPTRFPDVAADHWASGLINAAVETGIIQGYTDGQFKPDRNVTYAEVVAMLVRAVGREPASGTWPDKYLAAAGALGITGGLDFRPGDNASRGDVAILASRAMFEVVQPSGTTLGQAYGVSGQMTVHYVDVGDGDAALIVTPAGNAVLIDAGPLDKAANLVAYINALGIQEVDAVVMSHAYGDHIGGMGGILANFEVGAFYDPGYAHSGNDYTELKKQLANFSIDVRPIRCSTRIEVDPWVELIAANPGPSGGDILSNCVVLKATYESVDFLFAGDASTSAQGFVLVQSVVQPTAQILKVPGHAAAGAVLPEFLSIVDPSVAIVSVGRDDKFGRPAVETLRQLAASGAQFYRTDMDGTVTVTTDGTAFSVQTQPPVPLQPPTGFIGDQNQKVYHLPECRYLPAAPYRVKFATEQLATEAGYSPCADCQP